MKTLDEWIKEKEILEKELTNEISKTYHISIAAIIISLIAFLYSIINFILR
jgi:hypothetical protein